MRFKGSKSSQRPGLAVPAALVLFCGLLAPATISDTALIPRTRLLPPRALTRACLVEKPLPRLPLFSVNRANHQTQAGARGLQAIPSRTIRSQLVTMRSVMLAGLKNPMRNNQEGRVRQSPKMRLLFLGAIGSGTLTFLYREFNASFGAPNRKLRIGSDWTSDHAMQLDEFLHFMGSYHLTQAMTSLLRWSGVPGGKASLYGALGVGTLMTALELLDGMRSRKPASITDFAANIGGIAFALVRPKSAFLRNIDFSVSFDHPTGLFKRDLLLRYDHIRAWVSYSLKQQLNLPLSLGLGYGVRKPFEEAASRQYYLSLGLNLAELFSARRRTEIGNFDWLGAFRISPAIKF
ncbi:MAG: DUF2279 domain-containing protein [bacterium]